MVDKPAPGPERPGAEDLVCWANKEERLRAISFNEGADVKGGCARISKVLRSAQQSSRARGHDDMRSDILGHLPTSP